MGILGRREAGYGRRSAVLCSIFVGEQIAAEIIAEFGGTTSLSLDATGVPPGGSFPPQVGTSEVSSIFSWVPAPFQTGGYRVDFIAEAAARSLVLTLFIDVSSGSFPTPTPTMPIDS